MASDFRILGHYEVDHVFLSIDLFCLTLRSEKEEIVQEEDEEEEEEYADENNEESRAQAFQREKAKLKAQTVAFTQARQ